MVVCRLFYGTWPDKNGRGTTNLLVEQVSHVISFSAAEISPSNNSQSTLQ